MTRNISDIARQINILATTQALKPPAPASTERDFRSSRRKCVPSRSIPRPRYRSGNLQKLVFSNISDVNGIVTTINDRMSDILTMMNSMQSNIAGLPLKRAAP